MNIIQSLNLLPVEGSADTLGVAPQPIMLHPDAGVSLACAPLPDGRHILISACGRQLYHLIIDPKPVPPNGSVTPMPREPIAQLPADPSAVAWDGVTLTLTTDKGPWSATFDPQEIAWTVQGLEPQWPAVCVEAIPAEQISVTLAPEPLSKAYTPAETPLRSDAKSLADTILHAYDRLDGQARTAGLYAASLIVRCRLEDEHGNPTFVYNPQLLRPSASDLDGPLSFASTDRKTLLSRLLSVKTFRLAVTVADTLAAAHRRRAARLVVSASPVFHPVGASDDAILNFSRDTGEGYLRVTLPPAEHGLIPANELNNAATIGSVLSRLDELLEDVLVIPDPFARARTYDINRADTASPAATRRALAKVLAQPVKKRSLPALLAAPHSFDAEVVGFGTTALVWGNIRPLPFDGWSPQCFATRFVDKPWRAWVQVVADGGRSALLWQGEGTDKAPVEFAPLLCYPLGGMQSITITVDIDGEETLTLFRTLQSTPDGSFSWSLDASLQPIVPVHADEPTPPELPRFVPNELSRYVLLAPKLSPLSPVAAFAVGDVPTAVVPAASSSGAWDYGRERFYVFTRSGTRLVVTDLRRASMAASVLDDLAVASPAMVAAADGCAYLCRGRALMCLSGRTLRSVGEELPDAPYALGRDAAADEIVAATPSAVYRLRLKDKYLYSAPALTPAQGLPATVVPWLSTGGDVFATNADGLIALSRRRLAEETYVRYVERRELSPWPGRSLSRVVWNIQAEHFRGELTVDRTFLDARRAALCRFRVDGALRSPLVMPLRAHRLGAAILTLDALASPDLRLRQPS